MSSLNSERKKSLEKATAKYEQNLDKAASYLSARGITRETAVALRLGLVGEETAVGHELMVGRLSIPYLTRSGIVDMKFRCIQHDDCKQSDCVKYLALAGLDGSRLYNVSAFFADSDIIGLCEGEVDTMTLHYQIGVPAVGCPGVQRWEKHFARCFSGYSQVLVFSDGDSAGREFSKRVASEMPQATVVNLPQGQDVNSLFLAEGSGGVLRRAGLNELP